MPATNITTPVGRLVMGSLYKPQTTDAEGKPLIVKSGPNAGQPKVQYFFALAVPKNPGERHWGQTPWGATIWKVGHDAFPQGQADSPTFAWKIVDGDSTVPNRAGKKPCDREGYPGNWVLSFSSGFAPKIYNADGSAQIADPDAVKLGYYIQVAGTVDGNGSAQQPGVFLNHGMVALSAYGEEIHVGPDAASAGFGQSPLPAGAMKTPPTAFVPPVSVAQPNPMTGAAPTGYGFAPVGQPVVTTYPQPAAPPNPAFLVLPPVPVPAAPPPKPQHVMTALAQGATYDAMIGAGWTDALLVQHGMMLS